MEMVESGAGNGHNNGIIGQLVLGRTECAESHRGSIDPSSTDFDEVVDDPLQTSQYWEELLDENPIDPIMSQMDIDSKYDLTEKRIKRLHRKFLTGAGPGPGGVEGLYEALKFQGIELAVDKVQLLLETVRRELTEGTPQLDPAITQAITYEQFRFIFKRLKMAQIVRLSKIKYNEDGMKANLIEYPEFPEDDLTPQSNQTYRPVDSWLFAKRDDSPKMRWVHTEGFNLPTLCVLAAKYQFHPLAVEDAITMHRQASKIDRYGEHVFCGLNVLQLQIPGLTSTQGFTDLEQPSVAKLSRIATLTRISTQRATAAKEMIANQNDIKSMIERGEQQVTLSASYVCVFLSQSFDTLVSLRVRHTDENLDDRFGKKEDIETLAREFQVPTFANMTPLPDVQEELTRRTKGADLFGLAQELRRPSSKLMEHRSDFLLYKIVDRVVDELAPIVAAYTYRLKFFQDELQRTKSNFNHTYLDEIAAITLELKDILRTVRPLTGVLKFMFEDKDIGRDFGPYVEDLRDKAVQRIEDFKELIEHCSHISGQHMAMSDRKMNDTLYVLTIVTTIFIPAQFVTGMYGMNFVDSDGNPGIPELTWENGYVYFWSLVVALVLTSSGLFRYYH